MSSFAEFGNDLYTGKRSIDFVGRQKTWYAVSAVLLVLATIGLFGRGLNVGLEFRGGSEFRVSSVTNIDNFEARGKAAIGTLDTGSDVVVTKIGTNTVRIQTEKFQNNLTDKVKTALASEFKVSVENISVSTVGASWGASVSQKAITALIWFLILVSLVLAPYFRTWKMSLAALIALAHDLVITVGIYALAGFEVTPASVIGFLTILGYSLYDTVVVFDKVRENTLAAEGNGRLSYSQAANQAVNQTLVRSINTSVVALLPVASILVIGFFLLGPRHAAGPQPRAVRRNRGRHLLHLHRHPGARGSARARAGDAGAQEAGTALHQAPQGAQGSDCPLPATTLAGAAGESGTDSRQAEHRHPPVEATRPARALHPYVQTGPRNQPKRPPKSKR